MAEEIPMTAKSETVGVWSCTKVRQKWNEEGTARTGEVYTSHQIVEDEDTAKMLHKDFGWTIERLVPESALAEARRTAEYWKAEHLAGNEQLTTLISGLEALAGEWDAIVKRCVAQSKASQNRQDITDFEIVAGSYKDAAERLRALVASAGLEGKSE
jgi:hypothetical protein